MVVVIKKDEARHELASASRIARVRIQGFLQVSRSEPESCSSDLPVEANNLRYFDSLSWVGMLTAHPEELTTRSTMSSFMHHRKY